VPLLVDDLETYHFVGIVVQPHVVHLPHPELVAMAAARGVSVIPHGCGVGGLGCVLLGASRQFLEGNEDVIEEDCK
jgi:hypothetical protein